MDANTGAILHNESGDAERHPASLTKMMTLYLTFETLEQGRMSMSSMVSISESAANVAPSKLDLDPGEEITVREAILALITKSANDVSVALAEKIGGSESNFVRLMNAKARELGMSKTRFYNPNGLPHPDQVTTARDMVTLALHLQDDFPKYYPMFATRAFSYRGRSHRNHNTLMNNFAGIDGIKTGYTRASGFNLVTSLRRGGRHLVGAVFGGASAATRNGEMRMLLTRAINRASTVKTRKPAPMLIAKLKSEPKRAERPAAKAPKPAATSVAGAAPVLVEKTGLDASNKPQMAAKAASGPTKAAPKPAPMVLAEAASKPVAGPAASRDTGADEMSRQVPATPVAAESGATPPGAPVEVTKVRRVVVAPRQGPKRPPPSPAETTDMAAVDDGAGDLPDVSETIVPKTSTPEQPRFAAVADSKASMLGAADVPPPAEPAEVPTAPAAATVQPIPAAAPPQTAEVASARMAVKAQPAAPSPSVATAESKPAVKPGAAQRAKVTTASLTTPTLATKPKPAVLRTGDASATIQRGLAPSSFEAQAAALKAPATKRVAALGNPAPRAGVSPAGGRFEIQIGAFASIDDAQKALDAVQARAGGAVANHPSVTQPVKKDGRQIFRARFRGFDSTTASNACSKLRAQAFDCFVMSAE